MRGAKIRPKSSKNWKIFAIRPSCQSGSRGASYIGSNFPQNLNLFSRVFVTEVGVGPLPTNNGAERLAIPLFVKRRTGGYHLDLRGDRDKKWNLMHTKKWNVFHIIIFSMRIVQPINCLSPQKMLIRTFLKTKQKSGRNQRTMPLKISRRRHPYCHPLSQF